ncbi:lysoplasmalogenase family protein [Vibrio variabilis]|uniref:lysoplasmalogenase family protein n=1 Tax=Vibrio variabilis TaxID=990271 RepID=UPI0013A6FC74|nr:lysoplasmalogenase family protein [Vibrio variabilis]
MWSWLAVALSGLLYIFADEKGDKVRKVLFSLLTHALLATMILAIDHLQSYQMWMLLGLGVFAVSDAIAQWQQHTKLSFVGFIIAQLVYSWGCGRRGQSVCALVACTAAVYCYRDVFATFTAFGLIFNACGIHGAIFSALALCCRRGVARRRNIIIHLALPGRWY